MTFKTGHAIGMKTKTGAEILMHIGMDTVNLQGKGFDTLVEKDQEVKAGDPLVKFDIDLIKKAGYPVTTPMVVTNSKDFDDIKQIAEGDVKVGQAVLNLKLLKQRMRCLCERTGSIKLKAFFQKQPLSNEISIE